MFGRKKIRNKELDIIVNALEMDMANNYKDAAQIDYKRLLDKYATMTKQGKVKAKHTAYYEGKIKEYGEFLAHFTHFEGPGTQFDMESRGLSNGTSSSI